MRNSVSTVAENHMTEYEQACEHYRQGFRSLFEVCKLYILFQAALLTVLGVVISRVEISESDRHLRRTYEPSYVFHFRDWLISRVRDNRHCAKVLPIS